MQIRITLDGQPEGADPEVGGLGYYYPDIVVLGRLDGDAPARIAQLDGPVTATVEAG